MIMESTKRVGAATAKATIGSTPDMSLAVAIENNPEALRHVRFVLSVASSTGETACNVNPREISINGN